MTRPRETDARLHKGTRRIHLASGEVWRVQVAPTVPPLGGGPRRMIIIRESDERVRSVGEDYWLGDGWGSPKTRAGARS